MASHRYRLQLPRLSKLQIDETSLTGSIPQVVRLRSSWRERLLASECSRPLPHFCMVACRLRACRCVIARTKPTMTYSLIVATCSVKMIAVPVANGIPIHHAQSRHVLALMCNTRRSISRGGICGSSTNCLINESTLNAFFPACS
jgi:hypothetical protein